MSQGSLISVNFDQVPDKLEPLTGGIYHLKNLSVEIKASENPEVLKKNPNAASLIVEHEVLDEGKFKGYKRTKYISTEMHTAIKRLALSSGVMVGSNGLNIDDLTGKTCIAEIQPNAWKDKNTGQMREGDQIKDYLIPGDPGYAA